MARVLGSLGFVSIIYGVTILAVRSGTAFHVVWFALGLALLAAAWMTKVDAWSLAPAGVRRAGLAALAASMLTILVTQGLILSEFWARGESELDCIVVLGAQVRPDGTPALVLRQRLDVAVAYLEANPHTRCVVSGGRGANEPVSEASCMAAYLKSHGISADRIDREDRSRNTAQNIRNALEFIDAEHERVGIVTNNFHVFRATRLARHAGMRHVCGIAAPTVAWYLPNNLLRESMGIVKDAASGNL